MPDQKISELPVAPTITGDDVSMLVSDTENYQYSFAKLLQYITSNISTGNKISFVATIPQDSIGKNDDVAINTTQGAFYQKRNGSWALAFSLPTNNDSQATPIIYGTGEPNNSNGQVNDTYINTTNGKFYKKSGSGWQPVFSMLNGPPGGPGPKGDTGSSGINGKTLLYGSINPSNGTTGTNGDFYINTTTWVLFGPKVNGSWPGGVTMIVDPEGVGNINDLHTNNKSSLVAAVNEVLENGLDEDDIDETLKLEDDKLGVNLAEVTARRDFDKLVGALVPHPNYRSPTLILNANVSLTGEVGESRTPALSLVFSRLDAGAAISYQIRKAGNVVSNSTQYTDNITLGTSAISYQGYVNHNQGDILNNIIDIPDPEGRIGANQALASNVLNFTGYYATWYGPAAAIPSSGASARSLPGKQFTSQPNTFVLNTLNTQTTLVVVTAPGKSLASVVDLDALNAVITSEYVLQGTISVNDIAGNPVPGFKLYVKQMGVAYSTSHRHQITLA
ncbi:hypothetical protein ABDD95_15620 [Mucilaginibacter sp. PAMB04274]|uniref:hypothetical protein n=1 Tax=Mucilaginibacter sp. PAMB04274 TaxID=3138568 RepID=UPI0031F60EDA